MATVASSVLSTQAHQYSSPAALAILAAAGGFAGVLIVVGLPGDRPASLSDWLLPMLAGAGGFVAAPWMVTANRYTDAPPGSEVLFVSVAAWGAVLALALALTSSGARVRRIGGVLLALAGAAALLANWERPSSFSPFVRYAREELLMLAAGVLWTALVLVLVRAQRRGSFRVSALAAGLGAVAGAGVLAVLGFNAEALAESHFTPAAYAYGVAVAFAVAGVLLALRAQGAHAVAGAYLLVPAATSLLLIVEWAIGPFGPQPMLLDAVVAASAITAAGIVVMWPPRGSRGVAQAGEPGEGSLGPGSAPEPVRRSVWGWLGVAVAAISAISGAAALALPTMTALVRATRADGTAFRATFDLFGYEVAGPWIVLGVVLAVLGLALARPTRGELAVAAAALAVGIGGWWVAGMTPLRTLTSFIPSDVQVDYGSEFARIDFSGTPTLVAAIALGGAALAVALLWFGRAVAHPGDTRGARTDHSGAAAHGSEGDRS